MLRKLYSMLLIMVMITVNIRVIYANEAVENALDLPAIIEGENLEEDLTELAAESLKELADMQRGYTNRYIMKQVAEPTVNIEIAATAAFAIAQEAKHRTVSEIIAKSGETEESILAADAEAAPVWQEAKQVLEKIEPEIEATSVAEGIQVVDFSAEQQMLIVNEEVDPEIFIQEMQDELGDAIEYIQPDYELELAGEKELTVEVEITELEDMTTDLEVKDAEEILEPEATSNSETDLSTVEQEEQPEEAKKEEILEVSIPARVEEDAAAGQEIDENNGEGITVAVIDTGIDVTHPDLMEHVINGYDFVNDSVEVYDASLGMEQVHGTHVAGIIAKTAPGARIMPLKCFENGRAYTSNLIEAIEYAKEQGASIVNCSWGSTDNNQALREAMEESGLLFVCAAGNNRRNIEETPIYPASFDLENIISVGSLNEDKGLSYYSNYGSASVDITAVGREVESAYPGGEHGIMNGTSVAAGYVTAGAAIAASMDETEIKEYLMATADKYTHLQSKAVSGNSINIENIKTGTVITDIASISYEDDFDAEGYQPTPEESWELFSSLETVEIVAGSGFNAVLKSDGSVWTWGDNSYGQQGNGTDVPNEIPQQVIGLADIVTIGAGEDHILAVNEAGQVYAWGYDIMGAVAGNWTAFNNLPSLVAGISNVKEVDGGRFHAIALTDEGDVYTWGYDTVGQLGNGGTSTSTPMQLESLSNIKTVAAGTFNSAAVSENGVVYAWGRGEVGDGTTENKNVPTVISTINDVDDIDIGESFFVALKTDGSVYTWGSNNYGQLGDGTTTAQTTPKKIVSIENIVQISAGGRYIAALKEDGNVYTWGQNSSGQLGINSTTNKSTPTQVSNLNNVVYISAGASHMLAKTADGKIYSWGNNTYGEVGDGTSKNYANPILVAGMANTETVAAGGSHTLFLKDDGTVYACGSNQYGQIGDGTTTQRGTPKLITGITQVKAIAAGTSHSIAIKEDGSLYAWGYNGKGQLGNGTTTKKTTPTLISGISAVKAVAGGKNHTIALTESGSVYTWGDNNSGQLGDGTTTNRTTPQLVSGLTDIAAIAAGPEASYAITSGGALYAWGDNGYGQLGTGNTTDCLSPTLIESVANVKMVQGGIQHTVILTTEGTVYTCGDNYYGQLGDGTNNNKRTPEPMLNVSGIQQIAAGNYHTSVLSTDGLVYSCGSKCYYYIAMGPRTDTTLPVLHSKLTGVESIAAKSDQEFAITVDGNVYGRGNNGSSQLGNNYVSQYLAPYCLSPLFSGSGSGQNVSVTCQSDEIFTLNLTGKNITNLAGKKFYVTYDPAQLTLIDPIAQTFTQESQNMTGQRVYLFAKAPGQVGFSSTISIPSGKQYTGLLNGLRFQANAACTAEITVIVESSN